MSRSADSALQHLLVYAKGTIMGVSDSVPGVSGGTIAVAANIYDRIIYALRAVDAGALRLLLKGRVKECWKQVDGTFLLLLGLGIGSGLLLSANLIVYLIENNPEPLRAFFIGLIAAAIWMLRGETALGDRRNALAAVGGALLVLLVSMASSGESQPSALYLFFCGMIAISAMLLPGLSGAFILLLLGAYEHMLAALTAFDIPMLLVFLSGCVLGVLLMSRIVAWLLRRHRRRAYGFICGMLAGSIPALWPWQAAPDGGAAVQFMANRPVAPADYLELTGSEPMILICLAALLAGLALTLAARSR
ncbi:MAG: DUF368 domain-containing protein [Gammaproteobacteria bacterium]|nr:DUF368 domain-containing protein [Gammaproteobacteria bacterium]MYG96017.1 DUF368 domain-containing protein [Gammaproteobacteria bacterium]